MSANVRAKKKFDSLHRVPWTSNWVFRRYSSAKRKEFVRSTGIPATDANAARAYREGLRLFDEWLGSLLPSGRTILIRDLGRAIAASKSSRRQNTQRSFQDQLNNHVNPAFGHLRPEQVTSLKWEQYDAEERQRVYRKKRSDGSFREYKRTKLFNTRKTLLEILRRAHEEGLIQRVPKLKNFDGPAAPPRALSASEYLRILRRTPMPVRLLIFIMYHQGARPSEILKYRWDMIHWGETPIISIPGEITKTGRSRKIPLNSSVARQLRKLQPGTTTPWIFPSRGGSGPLENYNAVWDRAMAAAQLDYTIYNLRDTWVTNRLKDGLSSTFIAKYIDSSTEMIERKYAVAEEQMMRKVAG